MTFAEKIRKIRKRYVREEWRDGYRNHIMERGLTGEELAEILGVRSKSTIHHWETGKTVTRDRKILRKVDAMEKGIEVRERAAIKAMEERGKESSEDRYVRELLDLAFSTELIYPERVTREEGRDQNEVMIRVKRYVPPAP